jgi:hypothetical protein
MSSQPLEFAFTLKRGSSVSEAAMVILAHLAWQADGCPCGRELQYLREAEIQFRATHHLLLAEMAAPFAFSDGNPGGAMALEESCR